MIIVIVDGALGACFYDANGLELNRISVDNYTIRRASLSTACRLKLRNKLREKFIKDVNSKILEYAQDINTKRGFVVAGVANWAAVLLENLDTEKITIPMRFMQVTYAGRNGFAQASQSIHSASQIIQYPPIE